MAKLGCQAFWFQGTWECRLRSQAISVYALCSLQFGGPNCSTLGGQCIKTYRGHTKVVTDCDFHNTFKVLIYSLTLPFYSYEFNVILEIKSVYFPTIPRTSLGTPAYLPAPETVHFVFGIQWRTKMPHWSLSCEDISMVFPYSTYRSSCINVFVYSNHQACFVAASARTERPSRRAPRTSRSACGAFLRAI